MAKTSALSFRVADDLKASLEQAATADGRSVSSFIERIIRAWLTQHGHLDQQTATCSLVVHEPEKPS